MEEHVTSSNGMARWCMLNTVVFSYASGLTVAGDVSRSVQIWICPFGLWTNNLDIIGELRQ